jgi:hypothetical protein
MEVCLMEETCSAQQDHIRRVSDSSSLPRERAIGALQEIPELARLVV